MRMLFLLLLLYNKVKAFRHIKVKSWIVSIKRFTRCLVREIVFNQKLYTNKFGYNR